MPITKPVVGSTGWGAVLNTALDDLQSQVTAASGGGMGPNWVAASNAPTSLKNAVLAGGGWVCDGTGDQAEIQAAINAFGEVRLTEGNFNIAGTITMPSRRRLMGSGPATNLVGASGLSGSYITSTADHIWLSGFGMSGGGEASGTHHIFMNPTSQSGFWTGADACINIENIVSRQAKGDGIRMTGGVNRDSKIAKIHVWDATGNGFYFDSPDGNADQLTAGTCGGYGIYVAGSNWHVANSKGWYSDKDGILIATQRGTFNNLEGQDCAWAGIRITGGNVVLDGFTADSNSYEGTTNDNIHSGVEVGRTETGTRTGGYGVILSNGHSYDKNESGRGFKQRAGVRLAPGIRELIMTGVMTGSPIGTGTHRNVTAGILFDTASDLTHATNLVRACMNAGTRMES